MREIDVLGDYEFAVDITEEKQNSNFSQQPNTPQEIEVEVKVEPMETSSSMAPTPNSPPTLPSFASTS